MTELNTDLSKVFWEDMQLNPEKYILTEELKSAVEVAITLGKPLIIAGEPGTGKTQLARKIAYDLSRNNPNFFENPFIFNTKTTSNATDIFYQYDAVRHFHDASIKKESKEEPLQIEKYITFQALGEAIVLSNVKNIDKRYLPSLRNYSDVSFNSPKSSVVLIDEIDKAPRDFPNDLLDEIENIQFRIKEDNNYEIKKGPEQKIIIIITSNSEKNLPDAFLRRCVFFYIDFPSKDVLKTIILNHLETDTKYANENLIEFFLYVRDSLVKKKPATAELISWLKVLEMYDFMIDENIDWQHLKDLDQGRKRIFSISFSVLAKTQEDLKKLKSESFLEEFK